MQFENGWKDEDPRVILSVVIGLLTVILVTVFFRAKDNKLKAQKKLAIEKGNIIRAKRVSIRRHHKDTNSGGREVRYHGIYEYTVDGEVRKYYVHSGSGLPLAYLSLYYTDSPSKVFSDYDHTLRIGCSLSVLLGIAACVLTMFLTGYISI